MIPWKPKVSHKLTAEPGSSVNLRVKSNEDLISSQPWVWLPRTVIRKDRRKAIVIWVTLMAAFLIYIVYIIYDTVMSRANPASNVEIKQNVFQLPDMAFCVSYLEGCLDLGGTCFNPDWTPWYLNGLDGFLYDMNDFDSTEKSLAIEAKYPGCSVIPLSNLKMDQEGIDNGDVTSLSASLYFFWDEDHYNTYNRTVAGSNINTQFVKVFFIDLENNVEAIGENIVDAKLPYERVIVTRNTDIATIKNHMVLTMTEFVGISSTSGKEKKAERTFAQSTTSAPQNWYWLGESKNITLSFMTLDVTIGKFEYTRIVEVDPVNGWTIIGSIGGIWQFVVLGFGMFFVYAEKQPPDMKILNMRKTIFKPARIITNVLSNVSSNSSAQVKNKYRQQSFSRGNRIADASQQSSPPERINPNTVSRSSSTRPRGSRPAQRVQTEDRDQYDEWLPPGWVERNDEQDGTDYINTIMETTKRQRPNLRASFNNRFAIQAVDIPMVRSRVRSASSSVNPLESKEEERGLDFNDTEIIQSSVWTTSSAPLRLVAPTRVDMSLPPNWQEHTTRHGNIYYANLTTKRTQLERPQR